MRDHDARRKCATWCAPAPACRARISSGCSILRGDAASTAGVLAAVQPTSRSARCSSTRNPTPAAAGYRRRPAGRHPDRSWARLTIPGSTADLRTAGHDDDDLRLRERPRANHVTPHDGDVDGKLTVGAMDLNYSILPLRPTGGAWTSARELRRYLALELAEGRARRRRIVSAANLLKRRKPQSGPARRPPTAWACP